MILQLLSLTRVAPEACFLGGGMDQWQVTQAASPFTDKHLRSYYWRRGLLERWMNGHSNQSQA